jgi:hypothetical protein
MRRVPPRTSFDVIGEVACRWTEKVGPAVGRPRWGRVSDEEPAAATRAWPPSGLMLSGFWPDIGRPPTSLKLLRDLPVPIR